MSIAASETPNIKAQEAPPWPLKRFSVAEYQRLIQSGALSEDDRLELLDGWLVKQVSKNPPHDNAVDLLNYLLTRLIPRGWFLRIQNAIALSASQPEPDLAVVRGAPGDYRAAHPSPEDVAVAIEIAETSLDTDREKRRIYARAGIPYYWLVNLVESCVEVYSQPSGRGRNRDYSSSQRLGLKDSVTLIVGGKSCGTIAVSDILRS